MPSKSILVVEDDPGYRELLELTLKEEGYQVATVADYNEALQAFQHAKYDLVICDLRLPGQNGLDLLKELKGQSPQTGFIILTALGVKGDATQALKYGADDYLLKGTINPDSLIHSVKKVINSKQTTPILPNSNNRDVCNKINSVKTMDYLIGQHPAIKEINKQIERVAPFRSPVLITGEIGTGKQLVARLIHQHSPFNEYPFDVVHLSLRGGPDQSGMPSVLLDSELFGYVKGAFPSANTTKKGIIEATESGMVFIHDIADMPLPLQAKLLRIVQHRKLRRLGDSQEIEISARIICATSKDLWAMSREGTFREDLLKALNTIHIHLPILREHSEDILPLADYFLSEVAKKQETPPKTLSPEAVRALVKYQFPGNVGELETMLQRAFILTEGAMITLEHFPEEMKPDAQEISVSLPPGLLSLKKAVRELTEVVEKELIRRALSKSDNNRTRAAKLLGISHRSLLYKLKDYPELLK
jgi:DNA-binding NtrC family response regulator